MWGDRKLENRLQHGAEPSGICWFPVTTVIPTSLVIGKMVLAIPQAQPNVQAPITMVLNWASQLKK